MPRPEADVNCFDKNPALPCDTFFALVGVHLQEAKRARKGPVYAFTIQDLDSAGRVGGTAYSTFVIRPSTCGATV